MPKDLLMPCQALVELAPLIDVMPDVFILKIEGENTKQISDCYRRQADLIDAVIRRQ